MSNSSQAPTSTLLPGGPRCPACSGPSVVREGVVGLAHSTWCRWAPRPARRALLETTAVADPLTEDDLEHDSRGPSPVTHHPKPKTPQDVVPPTGLTAEALDALDRSIGHEVTLNEPGELLTDYEGGPLAVGPTITTYADMTHVSIHRRDLDHLDITTAEARRRWPNLTIYDPEEGTP